MFTFEKLNKNPVLWTDGYKYCHKDQYPQGIEWIYETWTPRMSRIDGVTHVCFFGLQGAMGEMTQGFDEHFFKKPLNEVISDYSHMIVSVFGKTNPYFAANHKADHIEALHKLGYLPIKIKALKEGAFVKIGVPMFTIENTLPEFYWVPGFLESLLSSYIWQPMTSATIADYYKRILTYYAEKSGDVAKVLYQAGDFSMRGMGSPEASYRVSAGHLTSFNVSATISSREYLKTFYGAGPNVLIYTPSTEHSVACSFGDEDGEIEYFKHMLTKVYPSGNVSIVSDSYDFWRVVDKILPKLKDIILNRNGKTMIRPDSGEPVDIICGTGCHADYISIRLGLVDALYDIFGGTVNSKGYKELNPQISVIYGDSITLDRASRICQKLVEKGFASTNVNLGVGSFSYQYVTRDTFGFALKGTAERMNGEFKMIFKKPATDKDNFKKSQKGMVAVLWENDEWVLKDGLTPQDVEKLDKSGENHLEDFFIDGKFVYVNTFDEIRERIENESKRIYNKKND